MKGYDLFKDQTPPVLAKYPKILEVNIDEYSILKGEIDVIDLNGKFWETYSIEIHCSDQFPLRFPRLYETSNKFPKIADWHVFEDSGTCCVKILPEELIKCLKGITLLEYLDQEVLPYFFNQTHRKVEGYYVNGEYSHGLKGIIEFYSRVLKTDNLDQILRLILFISGNSRPDRTSQCFCGSNQKFRKCHRDSFDKLVALGKDTLETHAVAIHKARN